MLPGPEGRKRKGDTKEGEVTGDEWRKEENCLRERNRHCDRECNKEKKTGREIQEAEMHEERLETLCGERVETQPTPLGAETEAAVGGRWKNRLF